MNEYRTTDGRGKATRRWPTRATAVIVIGILTTAACGGTETDLGSEPVVSGDRTTVTTGPAATTTVTAADEGGVGPSGGPDTTRQVYDGAGGELVALLDDVLGPTDDVSAELARLSPHPSFPTPNGGAYLVGFAVNANPPESESRSNVVKVQFLADVPVDDLLTFYEAYYVGEGWEPSERSENEDDFGPTTELVLKDDDAAVYQVELSVAEPEDFQANMVEILYFGSGEDLPRDVANKLGDWTADWVPDGGRLEEFRVNVDLAIYGPRSTTGYQIAGEWLFEGQTDLVSRIQAMAADSGQPHEVTDDGVAYDDGPFPDRLRVTESSFFEGLTVDLNYSNDSAPSVSSFGTGQNQTETGGDTRATSEAGEIVLATSADLLPTGASRELIRASVIDTLGPSSDVSTAMAVFGSFPEMRTPNDAEIADFSTSVVSISPTGEFRAEQQQVVLQVAGATGIELTDFYESTLIGDGWIESSRQDQKIGASTSFRRSYTIKGAEAGSNGDPLVIEIDDRPEKAEVTITWLQILPAAEINLDRWLGWPGALPLPPGGRPREVGIAAFGNGQGAQIDYLASYRYDEEFSDDFPQVILDELATTSDYDASPLTGNVTKGASLSNDYFDEGSVSIGGRSLYFRLTHYVE